MKKLLKTIIPLCALALGLAAFRVHAEEHGGSLSTNLYSTLTGGYVASGVEWSYMPPDTNLWVEVYSAWYEQQKQQAINQFFLQARQTHGFWNDPRMLQYSLVQDNLRLIPLPSFSSTTTNFTLAYYPPIRRSPFGPQYPRPYIRNAGTPPLLRWWPVPVPPVQVYLGGPPWTTTTLLHLAPSRANLKPVHN
jgi:hypothetical protein